MYKLDGHSLEKGAWVEPESQPMTLIERGSSCTITLGPDAPGIGFDDWLLDTAWPEGPIVWRVRDIDEQTDTGTTAISLEHVIRCLEDTKLFDDVSTTDISGGDTCTAREAIEYLLSQQEDWILGECDEETVLPYEFSGGDSLLDAIESVSETLEDAEWWYDMSQYPFVLDIRTRDTDVMCEMRGGRNVSTLRRRISRSGMYTRIWPVGKNDLHIDDEYLSRNESLYGRIDMVETHQGKTTKEGLEAWAEGLLKRHCEPLVTITIAGLELSQETGEALDWIQLNRVCRCPLPEYHTTIVERVIKIQWRDRKKDPESMTTTLGNNAADIRDLTKAVESNRKSGGRAARGQAKQNYLFEANGEHLLYEVFDDCGHLHGILRMTEESLRVAFENLNQCTRSEFLLTSESLRIAFENGIASTRSEFQMTSESLRIAFERDINSARAEISVEAGKISQIVSAVGDDGEVTAASIVLAINQSTGDGEARIDADHVYIGNRKSTTVINGKLEASDITANLIQAKIETLATLNAAAITANTITAGSNLYLPNGLSVGANGVWQVSLTQDGDTYTLTETKLNGTTRSIGTFSRATSLSGRWSGGAYTATADPQDETCSTTLTSITRTGNIQHSDKNVYAYHKVVSGDGDTGFSQLVTLDATDVWNEGYLYCKTRTSVYVDGDADLGYGDSVRVYARADGTSMASVVITAPPSNWQAGYNSGYNKAADDWTPDSITISDGKYYCYNAAGSQIAIISGAPDPGGEHNITCSSQVASIGTNRGNRTNAGSFSKSGVQANTYLGFQIQCGGTYKSFYIAVNP